MGGMGGRCGISSREWACWEGGLGRLGSGGCVFDSTLRIIVYSEHRGRSPHRAHTREALSEEEQRIGLDNNKSSTAACENQKYSKKDRSSTLTKTKYNKLQSKMVRISGNEG